MIFLFHTISLLVSYLLRNLKSIQSDFPEMLSENNHQSQDAENSLKFSPPVYKQRYGEVFTTLIDSRWRTKINTLCDFGCAEFGLFIFLKQLNRLNSIIFVDIDEELLMMYRTKVYPLTIEYLSRREEALNISIFKGSVGEPDHHLLNVDVVTAIELIEHLYPDVLDAFPYNVFSYIEPKIIIVTTPNADFNILFSRDQNRFRHPDHKFEWTREQFQDWSNNIILRFPDYTVSFTEIGEGPVGTEALGGCSQMATFIRKDLNNEGYVLQKYLNHCICDSESKCQENIAIEPVMSCKCTCNKCSPDLSWGICTYYSCSTLPTDNAEENSYKDPSHNVFYKLLDQIEYPFECDSRTENEKILDEFRYRINTLGHMNGRFFVQERDRSEIPVIELLYGPQGTNITEIELCTLLKGDGYEIEDCIVQEIGESEQCVIYTPILMDNSSSSSETSEEERDYGTYYQAREDADSDWDAPVKDETNNKDETNENNQEYLEETDRFDDAISSPKLSSYDNRLHLRKDLQFKVHSLSSVANNEDNLKVDEFRINELDRFRGINSARNAIGRVLKFQQKIRKMFFKDIDQTAGPSNLHTRKKLKSKTPSLDSKYEPTSLEDAKSLTNCIIKNALNLLTVDDDSPIIFSTVPIQGHILVADNFLVPETSGSHLEYVNMNGVTDSVLDVRRNPDTNGTSPNKLKVENNIINFNIQIPSGPQPVSSFVSSVMSTSADTVSSPEENARSNGRVLEEDDSGVISEWAYIEDYQDAIDEFNVVERSSTEAVVDPNSTVDLTLDTEVPVPEQNDQHQENQMNSNYMAFEDLIVIVPLLVDPMETMDLDHANNDFPDWLLQILNDQVIEENFTSPINDLEEPHFFCQGDGLGVHSSLLSIEGDEDEEAPFESSDESEDYAEVDPGISSLDMSSLPEDSQGVSTENQDLLGEESVNNITLRNPPAPSQSEIEAIGSVSNISYVGND